jgi:hypothetical protein
MRLALFDLDNTPRQRLVAAQADFAWQSQAAKRRPEPQYGWVDSDAIGII